ncbi:MAG: sulfatase-like hydrolase/transferase [Verrucomicrobiales bacterium]
MIRCHSLQLPLIVLLGTVGMFACALPARVPEEQAAKPNIVVILADDLGYADIGVYGCRDVPTPHIDSIARSGVRFTSGYADHPVCSPSRAGLMTGRYQQSFGFEHNSGPERFASADFGVPRSVPMLSEKLKAAGYATGMMGKWHIGFREGLRPHERGFDEYYGFLSGARSFYPRGTRRNDASLMRNGKPFAGEKEYLTDAFARESAAFIDKHKDAPFFLYLAFNAVHAPLEATRKYEDRFPDITNPKRRTYAGMLSAMDDAVGRVLAKLKQHKLEENTLVFFYSDNGGPTAQTTSRNDPLRGFKGQLFEGGIRIPYLIQWKGTLPAGKVYHEPVRGFDVHATALAAAGAASAKGAPLDGRDLIPCLTGKEKARPHERLFWRAGRQHAARVGDWKLVSRRAGPPLLFNLKDDIGEKNDLAQKQPDKLKELQGSFARWSGEMEPARWIRQDASNAEVGGKLKVNRGRAGGQRPIEQFFGRTDQDGDGVITAAEAVNKALFNAADKDRDGQLTLSELRQYFRNRRASGQTAEPEKEPGKQYQGK